MKLCAPGEPIFLFIVCFIVYFKREAAYLSYRALHYSYSNSVRLFDRLSVRRCVNTTQATIMRTSQEVSPMTLVSL